MLTFWLSLLLCPSCPDASTALQALSHRRFPVREKAQRRLEALGEKARSFLHRGSYSKDPEVRRRCRDVLNDLDNTLLRSFRPWPMVDALWYSESDRRYAESPWPTLEGSRFRLYVRYLLRRGADGPPWQNYRLATQDLVQDWLAVGVPAKWIRAVLAEMRRRDQCFYDHHYGGRCPNWQPEPGPPLVPVPPGWMAPARR